MPSINTSKPFDFNRISYKATEFLIRLVCEDAPTEGRINLVRYHDHVIFLANKRWNKLTTDDLKKFFRSRKK